MKFYNTLTRQLEEFKPQDPNHVKIYTCGPTVYSDPHIGNFTAYIYWDTLIRALRINNYTPYRVMNITDVGHLVSDSDDGEDKMEKGARKQGKTVWEVAQYYTDIFLTNFDKLNLLKPDLVAPATDYIPQQISLVDALATRGYTYEITDGIYYDTSKFSTYADFARLDVENLKAGARVDFNDEKRNITDFAVWKFIQPGETHTMRWDYLGRPGYPGWHLECSAIIHATLGETIDIHTGGIDHIPVHHPNEIAQSEAAYDKPLANYWLHNDFITIDGQKISKSLGNTYTFTDLAERGFSHLDYRMWTLEGHYQSQRNFTFDNLSAAHQRLLKYRNWAALRHQSNVTFLDDAKSTKSAASSRPETTASSIMEKITVAMNDNLNTAQALSELDQSLDDIAPSDELLDFLNNLFGLQLAESTPDITDEQKQLIAERETARSNKDWAKSDKIRAQLEAFGITVLDTPSGPIWQYK